MATFDLTSKNFENSDTDFHTHWFSDINVGVRARFQRLCFLSSFLRTAGFTTYTKCALYIVENSIKRLWIDIFDSTWQSFVKLDRVFCTKGTLQNCWNKVRISRWWLEENWSVRLGERSNGHDVIRVGWSVCQAASELALPLALIVFLFLLIVSYDLIWLPQGCQIVFEFSLPESFRKCCQIYSTKVVSWNSISFHFTSDVP